jgi:hypothetical protein
MSRQTLLVVIAVITQKFRGLSRNSGSSFPNHRWLGVAGSLGTT